MDSFKQIIVRVKALTHFMSKKEKEKYEERMERYEEELDEWVEERESRSNLGLSNFERPRKPEKPVYVESYKDIYLNLSTRQLLSWTTREDENTGEDLIMVEFVEIVTNQVEAYLIKMDNEVFKKIVSDSYNVILYEF